MENSFSLLLTLILSISSLTSIISEDEENIKIKSLCEDPLIHSADRLVNNTVRVYRGQYYWELIGLPAKRVKVEGPFKIWNLNMGNLTIYNAVVTVLVGPDKGSTYKTEQQRYWAWDSDGKQFAGAVKGNFWDLIPDGGFEAAFHDGDKTDPTVVGFKGLYVYYFSTKDKVWTGDKTGHINGKFNENFPPDLTAAFSWPADDPKDSYIAYLFKRRKFCKRTKILKSGQNCDEWANNTILFGCPPTKDPPEEDITETSDTNKLSGSTASGAPPSSSGNPVKDDNMNKPPAPESPAKQSTNDSLLLSLSLALIWVLVCLTATVF